MEHAITRMSKIGVRDTETGCLRWPAAKNNRGYGQISVHDKIQLVHRVAYRTYVGEIPEGYEIDHVYDRGCRHVDCYEPAHLEAVTPAENTRRYMDRITHCKYGHEYTPENTYYNNNGRGIMGRKCRTCISIREKSRNRSRRG